MRLTNETNLYGVSRIEPLSKNICICAAGTCLNVFYEKDVHAQTVYKTHVNETFVLKYKQKVFIEEELIVTCCWSKPP